MLPVCSCAHLPLARERLGPLSTMSPGKAASGDTWILGKGFVASQFQDGWMNLTVTVFDQVFGTRDPYQQNPVLIQSGSGHLSFVNRRTLALAGVAAENPPLVAGGKVATFSGPPSEGLASGVLVELPAQALMKAAILPPAPSW